MTLNSIQHPTGCRYLYRPTQLFIYQVRKTRAAAAKLREDDDDDDYTRRKDALKPRSSLLNSCQVSSCLFISLIISFSDDGDDTSERRLALTGNSKYFRSRHWFSLSNVYSQLKIGFPMQMDLSRTMGWPEIRTAMNYKVMNFRRIYVCECGSILSQL